MVEPVCASFSLMRRPALRSKLSPFGFDVDDEQTRIGNILALRAIAIIQLCHALFLPGLLEQPWSGMMRYLPQWLALEKRRKCAYKGGYSPEKKKYDTMLVKGLENQYVNLVYNSFSLIPADGLNFGPVKILAKKIGESGTRELEICNDGPFKRRPSEMQTSSLCSQKRSR
ncbi:Uncharacterized protein SCF082_LOCUS45811 [Durusdinium trenchii]|uniref:Uncharacterized protein n=1 Tax=Durusdinium trenchii TaxID=1381693 RepID=A0ABP0RBX3_9DINO